MEWTLPGDSLTPGQAMSSAALIMIKSSARRGAILIFGETTITISVVSISRVDATCKFIAYMYLGG